MVDVDVLQGVDGMRSIERCVDGMRSIERCVDGTDRSRDVWMVPDRSRDVDGTDRSRDVWMVPDRSRDVWIDHRSSTNAMSRSVDRSAESGWKRR